VRRKITMPSDVAEYPHVDVADGLLPDVRATSIVDLLFDDESALDRALGRILSSNATCNFNSFNSSM
jgi:hypothetical protein